MRHPSAREGEEYASVADPPQASSEELVFVRLVLVGQALVRDYR